MSPLLRTLAMLAALLPCALHASADPTACWRELEYAAGNSWASASSTLHFLRPSTSALAGQLHEPPAGSTPLAAGPATSRLRVSFDAMLSHGELIVWYNHDNGQVLQSLRTGGGRESRRKLHRFLADGVWRERRAPDDPATEAKPENWPVRSRTVIPYPRSSAAGVPVSSSVLLLAEASRLAMAPGTTRPPFVVLADTHFYRVRLSALPTRSVEAGLLLQEGTSSRRIEGERTVTRIVLEPELLDGEPGEDPFRLLELEGDLQVAVDTGTGLPLRVQGTWMGMGTVTVNLVRARLDSPCAR